MTTIAISETDIAWDSQLTLGDERMICAFEKVVVLRGKIFAFAGDADRFELLKDWIIRGAKVRQAPKGNWDLIVINKSRRVHLYRQDLPAGTLIKLPHSIGSGCQFAMGAMLHGATAAEAVAIAAKCDINTGEPVKSLEIQKALEAKPKRARKKSATLAQQKETVTTEDSSHA